MRITLFSIVALLVGASAINLGLALQASLLGIRAGIENFSAIVTGLIMSGYYLGFVVGSQVAPAIVNRVGHIRAFSAFASIASAAALCHAVFVDPTSWVILRIITGLCFAALCLVTESWLNERSTNLNRGKLLSTYMIAILTATALGNLLLMLAPASGYDLFVVVSVIISLALVPVTLTSTPTPQIAEIAHSRMGLRQLYATSPVGVIGCFGSGLGTGAFWGLGAVFAQGMGLPTDDIALFMALMIGGGIVSQWPLGQLSDLIDRRMVIAVVALAMAAVGIFIGSGVVSQGLGLFIAGTLAGALLLPLYGISIAHTNDFLDATDFVPASASLLLVYGCGAVAGPFVASLIMEAVGPEGLFIHAAAATAAIGVFAFYRMTQRPPASEEDSVDFTLVPRTSAMVFEMDPRSEQDGDEEEEDARKDAEEDAKDETGK